MTCRCSKTHKKKKKTFSKTPLAQVGSAIENARKRNYTRNTVYWSPNNRVYRKRRVQKLRYTTIYDSHASHQCICFRRFPFTCVSCLFARHSYTTVRSCYNQCTREASARVTGYDVRPRIGTTVELTAYSKCFRITEIAQNIFSHILNPAYRIQGCLGKHSTHLSISGRPCRRQHTFLDLVLRKHWRSGVCSPETDQLKSPI